MLYGRPSYHAARTRWNKFNNNNNSNNNDNNNIIIIKFYDYDYDYYAFIATWVCECSCQQRMTGVGTLLLLFCVSATYLTRPLQTSASISKEWLVLVLCCCFWCEERDLPYTPAADRCQQHQQRMTSVGTLLLLFRTVSWSQALSLFSLFCCILTEGPSNFTLQSHKNCPHYWPPGQIWFVPMSRRWTPSTTITSEVADRPTRQAFQNRFPMPNFIQIICCLVLENDPTTIEIAKQRRIMTKWEWQPGISHHCASGTKGCYISLGWNWWWVKWIYEWQPGIYQQHHCASGKGCYISLGWKFQANINPDQEFFPPFWAYLKNHSINSCMNLLLASTIFFPFLTTLLTWSVIYIRATRHPLL